MDDHNLMAKQEHIEAIEAELDRMKKIATHVYEEMVSHTRRTSYSTHSTVFRTTLLTYSTTHLRSTCATAATRCTSPASRREAGTAAFG